MEFTAAFVVVLLSTSARSISYEPPIMPKLTTIPHWDISPDIDTIGITYHKITSLGPNEFRRYHKLSRLHLSNIPLNDNIHPMAFSGTNIRVLRLVNVGLTHLPQAVFCLNTTITHLTLNENHHLTNFTALQYLIKISKKLYSIYLQHNRLCILDILPNFAPQMCIEGRPHIFLNLYYVSTCIQFIHISVVDSRWKTSVVIN
jgi:hypothetical protein